MDSFLKSVPLMRQSRVSGTAIFLCGGFDTVPHALIHNLYHNKVLHDRVFLIQIMSSDLPHVPKSQRTEVVNLGEGFWGLKVRFGYMDTMNLVAVLRSLEGPELKFKLMESSFFVTHQTVLPNASDSVWSKFQLRLFSIMLRNAPSLSSFFKLPSNRVIEVGSQIEL